MSLGFLFALAIEAAPLVERLSGHVATHGPGFVAHDGALGGKAVTVLVAGPGQQAATRGTAALIAGHRPRWIISAGFAGGLDPRLALGDLLMIDEVVDTHGLRLAIDLHVDAASLPSRVHVGRLLTSDRVITAAAEKEQLGQQWGALAVDMETSAAADVCRQEQVRFMACRVISDDASRDLPPEIEHLLRQRSTSGRVGAALGAVVRRPKNIKELWRLHEAAVLSADRLASFLVGVAAQLD